MQAATPSARAKTMEMSKQETDASKMLEAALQQMDGIISNTAGGGESSVNSGNGEPRFGQASSVSPGISAALKFADPGPTIFAGPMSERSLISASNVLATAKTLALALQQVGGAAPPPDPLTAALISDWLEMHVPRQDVDERLRRLQRDKEALATQYQSMVDRYSEQANKIIELEGLLTEKTQQLSAKDEQLQRQMLSQSSLETQKLELMTALSELKLHRAALERENVELTKAGFGSVTSGKESASNDERSKKSSATSGSNGALGALAHGERQRLLPFGSMGNLNNTLPYLGPPKTPPASIRHQILPQFHSLPRSARTNNSNKNNNNNNNHPMLQGNSSNQVRGFDPNANAQLKQRNVAFASNEKILIDDNGGSGMGNADSIMYGSFTSQSNSITNLRERSAKGLRNIFGKLRRSNSGNLEIPALEQAEPEFKRGGVGRATAGGRIEWTTQTSQISNSSKGYSDWSPQEVCNWLCDLGLGCYEEDCRKWLKSNPSVCFFTASPVDIERELFIKVQLHRKKITLAIDELTGKEEDVLALRAAQLDTSWVLRWLDDIGLPQYKDAFLCAKIDGRMLHLMTLEDIVHLQVTSCLHIASIRCGIQVMREYEWNPECLIRRSTVASGSGAAQSGGSAAATPARSVTPNSSSDECTDATASEDNAEDCVPEYIALWTAHRVMEWLRVADLSEYAPNLRGAGVHGALMLYEPRFNAELLADLLCIPPSKTLLRRHLATHFKELLGREVIHMKRDVEAQPGFQPLTIAAKLKPPKKTQFSLKRRKSHKGANDIEWTDYLCPMTTRAKQGAAGASSLSSSSMPATNVFTSNNNNNNNNNSNGDNKSITDSNCSSSTVDNVAANEAAAAAAAATK